jgi:hypothetical protein
MIADRITNSSVRAVSSNRSNTAEDRERLPTFTAGLLRRLHDRSSIDPVETRLSDVRRVLLPLVSVVVSLGDRLFVHPANLGLQFRMGVVYRRYCFPIGVGSVELVA